MRKNIPMLDRRYGVQKVLFGFIFVLFLIYAVTLIYPFIWLIMSSLKDFVSYQLDMAQGRTFQLPEVFMFSNYAEAFKLMKYENTMFIGMFINSLWQAFLSIAVGTLVSTAFSYTMARFRFPGKEFIYGLVITVMIMPIMTGSGATFKLYVDLGLYDNPLLFVATSLGWGSFLYYYAFFKGVSPSYNEAVYIDGGGEWTAFLRVVLPQAVSIMFALGVMSFIGKWNDYQSILLYMPSYPTVASGMYLVKNTLLRSGKDPIYFSGIVISIIPVLVLFICFSNLIMQNMALGGLKG